MRLISRSTQRMPSWTSLRKSQAHTSRSLTPKIWRRQPRSYMMVWGPGPLRAMGRGALPHQLPVQQVRARQPKKKKPRKKTSQAGNVFGKHGIPPETGDLSVGKKDKHPSQKDTPLDQLLIYADDTPEDIIRKMRGRRLAIRSIGSLSR